MRHVIIAILIVLAPVLTLRGQGLYFERLTRADGLLHENVTCVAQDTLGFIWIGTHRGLNRFDGYHVDSYRRVPTGTEAVYANRVYSMQPVGPLMVMATEAGLTGFDMKAKRYVALQSTAATRQAQDADRRFMAQVEMVRRGPAGGQLLLFSPNAVRSATVSPDGRISLKAAPRGIPSRGEGLHDMCCTASATRYHLYADRLERVDAGGRTAVALPPADGARTLAVSRGSVWVGSSETLLQLDRQSLAIVASHHPSALDPHSLLIDINSLFVDAADNLWVSGWNSGVAYASSVPRLFRHYRSALASDPVSGRPGDDFFSAVGHDPSTRSIWTGSNSGHVGHYLPQSGASAVSDFAVGDKGGAITSIAVGRDRVYASQGGRIYVIDKASHRVVRSIATSRGGYIFHLAIDRWQRLWAATYAGLECFALDDGRPTGVDLRQLNASLHTQQLHNLYADGERGELLITSAGGLRRVLFGADGSVRRVLRYQARPGGLPSDYLWPIARDPQGDYWVGTMGSGLCRVTFTDDRGGYTAQCYGTAEGAASPDVESIEVDSRGRVWCGRVCISCFDPEIGRFCNFTPADGLQSTTFGTSSSAASPEGHIFFGGTHGLSWFDSSVASAAFSPVGALSRKVRATHVEVSDTVVACDVETSGRIALRYPHNNLRIGFSNLTYAPRQRYRYRLVGYDHDWRVVPEGRAPLATFHHLPYGTLTLEVESGDWRQWSGEVTTITIESCPPWWLSWPMKAVYALIGLAVGVVIFRALSARWRRKQARLLEQQREQMRQKILAESKAYAVMRQLDAYLDEHLTDVAISPDTIQKELGISRTRLFSEVKQASGVTLSHYIRTKRLTEAARLLATSDMSIADIAYSVGIESHSYFTRIFKEEYGCSPTEYARRSNSAEAGGED